MKKLWQEVSDIFRQKAYVICVILTAVLSYGFAICHPMIGIDDSAIGRYYTEGVGAVLGRWGFYLINKICPVVDYTPFITDFIGVVFLIIGSALWCVVWQRAIGKKLSTLATTIFSCVMISSPIMSEVFLYYLHNGVGINYCLSALLMLVFMEAFATVDKKHKILKLLGALALLCLCNSFVETFTIVFLMAIVMVWVLQTISGTKKYHIKELFLQTVSAGVLLVVSIIVRSLAMKLFTYLFSLQEAVNVVSSRSVFMSLELFQTREGLAEFVMTIKKYIAMYYVNAIAYIPIRIYVLAVMGFFGYAIYRLIAKKQVLPLVSALAMQIIPFILVFIEGHATFYRTSQFIPLYVAFVAVVFTVSIESVATKVNWGKKMIAVWCILIGILVYNQAFEMTQWFYVDYMKYEDAKNTMAQISNDLERDFDTEKPVVFVGNYTIPATIVQKMYVPYDSAQYEAIARLLDVMDPNLKTCFAMPNGYSLSSEAVYSVFTWGNHAFEGWDKETHDFFAIHGHEFARIADPETVQEIQDKYQELPGYPKEGSIIETKDYIVVHFG